MIKVEDLAAQTVLLPYSFAKAIVQNTAALFSNSENTGNAGRVVYSALVTNTQALEKFLCESETAGPESERLFAAIEKYDKRFFETNALVAIFSDERSGANKLKITQAAVNGDVLEIHMLRERGLTMDMSYRLMLLSVQRSELGDTKKALTYIADDAGAGANIF